MTKLMTDALTRCKQCKCVHEADSDKGVELCQTHATSPELLEACKWAMGYLAGLPLTYRPYDAWFKPLSTAISKAEGGKNEYHK